MQFKSTLLSLSALSLLTSPITAIITGVTAPATITAGEEFTITLTTANYIQTVYDVAAAFGISPAPGYPDTLGAVFASEYLGPALSNTLDPIHFTVSVDGSTPAETALISVAVLSLYGVSSTPVVNTFNTTVTVV